jgi:hypothetical protein
VRKKQYQALLCAFVIALLSASAHASQEPMPNNNSQASIPKAAAPGNQEGPQNSTPSHQNASGKPSLPSIYPGIIPAGRGWRDARGNGLCHWQI